MDRQRRNNEIIWTTQGCPRIIGDSQLDVLLVREAQAGLVKHGRRHVDQMQHRVGVGRPHQCCQQAGTCPQVQHSGVRRRMPLADQLQHRAVESVEAGDQAPACGVVVLRGGVEGGSYRGVGDP